MNPEIEYRIAQLRIAEIERQYRKNPQPRLEWRTVYEQAKSAGAALVGLARRRTTERRASAARQTATRRAASGPMGCAS